MTENETRAIERRCNTRFKPPPAGYGAKIRDSAISRELRCYEWHGEEAMLVVTGSPVDETFSPVFSAAQAAVADVALITDSAQNIVHVSASFTAMTGYEQTDLTGENCRILQGSGTDRRTTHAIRELLTSGEAFEGEILNYRKNGSPFWTLLKIVPLRLGSGTDVTHFVSVQRDISNHVAQLKQLKHQALHDSVTGLPNRTAAEQAVQEAVRRAPSREMTVAIGVIDLDDFRLVNSTLGHVGGDEVLRQWATRMTSRLREGDVLARMGGDEFVLILKDVPRRTAHDVLPLMLDRIHGAVEEPFVVDNQQFSMEISLGIALVPEDGTDGDTILRSADEALFIAKKRDDPGIWWETAEDSILRPPDTGNSPSTCRGADSEEDASPEDSRVALNSGNIVVHFQPVVDLRDGTVHLFEALARLKLPGGRIAYPNEFLPHIGAEGLRTLFAMVLDQALKTLAEWDQVGMHHHVSVNLPPAVLLDPTIPALVEGLLREHEIVPERLGLELLESQDLGLDEQRKAMRVLTTLGVGLALDDLGSGYSTLQRLSFFPFSAIKLDRGLFNQVDHRPVEVLSVIATLIQLGMDLGMNAAVEGLENESLTEAAAVLGAPLGQGFYLAKPMPPEDCLRWLDSFTLTTLRSPLRTPLGALAYHWKFGRLAAPHPLDLDRCPLTRFISEANAPADVETWHSHQHEMQETHAGSSQLLITWLADHLTDDQPRSAAP